MKKIFVSLFLFASLLCCAQRNYNTTLKIAAKGDSFCAGGNASTLDSFFISRIAQYFRGAYDTVILYKLCTGGETTYKGLPAGSWFPTGYDFYSAPDTARNITKVLSLLSPGDLVLIEYSGNDFAIGVETCDTVKKNLTYYANQYNAAGINFIMSGISPRQNHDGSFLYAGYYTGADTINSFVSTTWPYSYGDIWTGLNRGDGRMIRSYQSSDSVHPNDIGHRYQYLGMINNEVTEKLYCNCKGYCKSFNLTKIGDSVSVSGDFLGYKLVISGSNDGQSFTPVATYHQLDGYVDKRVYGNTYYYYKAEFFSTKLTKTRSKRINF